MKILYIKANPKKVSNSISSKVACNFIEEYRKANPSHEIDTIDLFDKKWPHVTRESLEDYSNENGIIKSTARNFTNYDKYIFSVPMWNLSVPSILKAYFDHVLVSGITFKYNDIGIPIGLLKNKKAVCILARGGNYSYWPMSNFAHDRRYLKHILKFIGIKDITFLEVNNTEKNRDRSDKIVKKMQNKIIKIIQKF